MSPAVVAALALGRFQALLVERDGLDERLSCALREAVEAGVPVPVLAASLGVHRTSVYRMLERVS